MAQSNLSESVLVESKSARDGHLSVMSHESASDALSKGKAMIWAAWHGTGIATTAQMAEYYEVPEDTVQTIAKRHKDELESDGLKVARGKALKDVVSILNTTSKAPSLTTWTPRSALRLGFLLRDSEVARQVRTVILDAVEKVPKQSEEIQALTIALELERLRGQNLDRVSNLATLHGTASALALMGHPDRIVEIEKPTIEIIDDRHNVRFKGQTLTQVVEYLKTRHGIRFKSGAELKRYLEKAGNEDLIAQTVRSFSSDYVPEENLAKLYEIVTRGDRQKLIGED